MVGSLYRCFRICADPMKKAVKRLKNKVLDAIAPYKYGNYLPYQPNRIGELNWQAAKKRYQAINKAYDKHIHQQFITNGFIVLDEVVPADILQRLTTEYNAAITDPTQANNPFDDRQQRAPYKYGEVDLDGVYRLDLMDVAASLPSYQAVFTPGITHAIESCLASHFFIDNAYAWRNYHCPEEVKQHFEPHSNRWHFDSQYADRIKMFVYLTDVDEGDGGFECISRPHSRHILAQGFKRENRKLSTESGLAPSLFYGEHTHQIKGKKGSILLCLTSFCIHRAGHVDQDHQRDVLQFCLRPNAATESDGSNNRLTFSN